MKNGDAAARKRITKTFETFANEWQKYEHFLRIPFLKEVWIFWRLIAKIQKINEIFYSTLTKSSKHYYKDISIKILRPGFYLVF